MADFVDTSSPETPRTPGSSGYGGNLNENIANIISMLDTPGSSAKPQHRKENQRSVGQPLEILKGVVAYVEVRSIHENRSKAVAKALFQLGAMVTPKFTDEVTHVVFKDGGKRTQDKAVKKGVHLVSVLWVESCKQNGAHVDEQLFPATISIPSKGTPLAVARLKKLKSMQPKDFEEELVSSAERGEKRRKRLANAEKWKTIASPVTPMQFPRKQFFVAETQKMTPDDSHFSPNVTVPDTPPSMRAKMQLLLRHRQQQELSIAESSDSDTALDSPTATLKFAPLQTRLFAKMSSSRTSLSDTGDTDANATATRDSSLTSPSTSLASSRSNFSMSRAYPCRSPKAPTMPSSLSNFVLSDSTLSDYGTPLGKDLVSTVATPLSKTSACPAINAEIRLGAEGKPEPGNTGGSTTMVSAAKASGARKMRYSDFPGLRNYSESKQDATTGSLLSSGAKKRRKSEAPAVATASQTGSVKSDTRPNSGLTLPVAKCGDPNLTVDSTDSSPAPRGRRKSVHFTAVSKSVSGRSKVIAPSSSAAGTVHPELATASHTKTQRAIGVGAREATGGKAESSRAGGGRCKSAVSASGAFVPISGSGKATETVQPTDPSASRVQGGRGRRKSVAVPGTEEILHHVTATEHDPRLSTKAAEKKSDTTRRKSARFVAKLSSPGRSAGGENATVLASPLPKELASPSVGFGTRRSSLFSSRNRTLTNLTPSRRSTEEFTPSQKGGPHALKVKKTEKVEKRKRKKSSFKYIVSSSSSDDEQSDASSVLLKATRRSPSSQITQAHRSTAAGPQHGSKGEMKVKRANGKSDDDNGARDKASSSSGGGDGGAGVSQRARQKPSKNRASSLSSSEQQQQHQAVRRCRSSRCASLSEDGAAAAKGSGKPADERQRLASIHEAKDDKENAPEPSLVMTSMHRDEQDVVIAVVRKLGVYQVKECVSATTSHVVCGNNRRTLNVLQAIARGCWLVSLPWVLKSLEEGHWLSEAPYEQHQTFPAAKVSRLEASTAGGSALPKKLFTGCGLIYVAGGTSPPQLDLLQLLQLTGGQVTSGVRNADVCVGKVGRSKAVNVSEQWVLDSLTSYKALPLENYRLEAEEDI